MITFQDELEFLEAQVRHFYAKPTGEPLILFAERCFKLKQAIIYDQSQSALKERLDRFRTFAPESRADIPEDAPTQLAAISTIELIGKEP